MTIREIIEKLAREAATGFYPSDIQDLEGLIRTTLIAILTDPQVGFKEALTHIVNNDCDCPDWPGTTCTCPCHTAEAKLKELEDLK